MGRKKLIERNRAIAERGKQTYRKVIDCRMSPEKAAKMVIDRYKKHVGTKES